MLSNNVQQGIRPDANKFQHWEAARAELDGPPVRVLGQRAWVLCTVSSTRARTTPAAPWTAGWSDTRW